MQAYQESELKQAKENLENFSEASVSYEADLLSLQRDIKVVHGSLREAENQIIELSRIVTESEEKNVILKSTIDKLDAEVADKNKV